MNENRIATVYDLSKFCKANCHDCKKCLLGIEENADGCVCIAYTREHTDKANEIVLKWCDEHPQKTYLQDFLEKYPDADMLNDSRPSMCRRQIDKYCQCGGKTCKECWNEVIE